MKCEACRAFYLFFRNEYNKFNLYKSTNVRFDLLHEMEITKKSHFLRENVNILPSFTHRTNERHYVTLLNL